VAGVKSKKKMNAHEKIQTAAPSAKHDDFLAASVNHVHHRAFDVPKYQVFFCQFTDDFLAAYMLRNL
jgi:hypothetical protein